MHSVNKHTLHWPWLSVLPLLAGLKCNAKVPLFNCRKWHCTKRNATFCGDTKCNAMCTIDYTIIQAEFGETISLTDCQIALTIFFFGRTQTNVHLS